MERNRTATGSAPAGSGVMAPVSATTNGLAVICHQRARYAREMAGQCDGDTEAAWLQIADSWSALARSRAYPTETAAERTTG